MKTILPICLGLLAVILSALQNVEARTIYAINVNGELVRLQPSRTTIGPITGTLSGITAIDFRPATGQLYALAGTGTLYIIDRHTAAATPVAQLSLPTSGGVTGIDFDPVTDRLRVVTTTRQNMSVNPDTGAATVEGPLNPGTQNPSGIAYTNSFPGATSTTLYVVINRSLLHTVNPASSGTLSPLIGGTSFQQGEFDIDPVDGTGWATMSTGIPESPYGYCQFGLDNGIVRSFVPTGFMELANIAVMREPARAAKVDYDRDKRTDHSVFRPLSNSWYALRSTDNTFTAATFGMAGDILTPGDYDGDEQTDIAVWRPSTGDFYVRRSSDGVTQFFHFGQNGDEPVPQDFDGDGRTDFAVVRRAGGLTSWYYTESGSGVFRAVNWGLDTDRIAPADYDGDGKCDVAVRRGTGAVPATFYILGSAAGYYGVKWGLGSDAIAPGDYDADGRSDMAVVRMESTYKWYILQSSNQAFISYHLGAPPHTLATGDYDGDGKTDPTVFIPAAGDFYSIRSSSGTLMGVHFGQSGDVPVAKYDTSTN